MTALGIINDEMQSMGLPYEFMRWTGTVQYPYWVGEHSEVAIFSEDGYKETTVMLTGTTTGSWLSLEEARELIEQRFHPICGLRGSTTGGSVAIFYENAFPVPTGEADLKRMQINLRVKEWKGAV